MLEFFQDFSVFINWFVYKPLLIISWSHCHRTHTISSQLIVSKPTSKKCHPFIFFEAAFFPNNFLKENLPFTSKVSISIAFIALVTGHSSTRSCAFTGFVNFLRFHDFDSYLILKYKLLLERLLANFHWERHHLLSMERMWLVFC